jgi:GT2 family glycosyltransferase
MPATGSPSAVQAEAAPPPVPCDLSIIIVSWNVWELLRGCLISIERSTRPTADARLRVLAAPPSQQPPAGQRTVPIERPAQQAVPRNRFGRRSARAEPEPQPQAQSRPAAPATGATVEVIVVDNGSGDGTPELLATHYPWVRVIANESNLGFTRANNQGYATAGGRFVYFLNPDTELLHDRVHGDSLWQLYEALRAGEGVSVVGPSLHYADFSPQSSARRFPTPLTGFFESTWLGRALPWNPWARRLHLADWPALWSFDVDWVVGAAMLCRRDALQSVMRARGSPIPGAKAEAWPWPGPFDERFFMYSEETDLCLRLKRAGWRVLHVPAAQVVHFEGRSSEQAVEARHLHFNRSKVKYWEKWFGRRWSEPLRHYLLLEYRLQIVLERAKWLVGSKRSLRSQRIAVYRRILATRLREEAPSPLA